MPITQTEPRTTPSILRASMIVHLRASRLFAMAPIHKIGADLEICVDLPLGFGYMSSVNQPMTLTTTRPLMRPLTKSSNADGSASSPMVRVTSLRWRGLRSDANRSQTR